MLFAAGATNNQGPTVQIVRRKNWNMDLDLVGHRKVSLSQGFELSETFIGSNAPYRRCELLVLKVIKFLC